MIKGIPKKDFYIERDGKKIPLGDCKIIRTSDWNIYYLPLREADDEGELGFYALGMNAYEDEIGAIHDHVLVYAYYDGIRHMYFNPFSADASKDYEGYFFYPSDLIQVFQGFNRLIDKHCPPHGEASKL